MENLPVPRICEILAEWLVPRDALKLKLVIGKVYDRIASYLNYREEATYHENMSTKCIEKFSNLYVDFVSDELLAYIKSGIVRKIKLMKNLRHRMRELLSVLSFKENIEVDYNFIDERYLSIPDLNIKVNSIRLFGVISTYSSCDIIVRDNITKIEIYQTLLFNINFAIYPNLQELVVISREYSSFATLPYTIFPKSLTSIDINYFHKDCLEDPGNIRVLKGLFDKSLIPLLVNVRVLHMKHMSQVHSALSNIDIRCIHIEELIIYDNKNIETTLIPHSLLRRLKVYSLKINNLFEIHKFLENCTNMVDLVCMELSNYQLVIILDIIRNNKQNIRLLDEHFVEIKLIDSCDRYHTKGNMLTYTSSVYELDFTLLRNITYICIYSCYVEDIAELIKNMKNLKYAGIALRKEDFDIIKDSLKMYNPRLKIINSPCEDRYIIAVDDSHNDDII